jgi:hypothetical protein
MAPEFNQKTIDVLGKRAAFKCSNPDCRITTIGPNTDPTKSTTIGEAAHIFGARVGSKRFDTNMNDAARAEITNAIWLCRNCHKLIDTDAGKYTASILFAWREQHEKYIQSELGNTTDALHFQQQCVEVNLFKDCPPIIRRIVIDKPDGWEWRLTAELMRHLNKPLFRKIKDLRDGLYVKPQHRINNENVANWAREKIDEALKLVDPITGLLERLNDSWGAPGEPGNSEEIYHITFLIKEYLEQVILYEEHIYFANVSQEYEKLHSLLRDTLGSQVEKISAIPDFLDESVALIGTNHGGTVGNPHNVRRDIIFNLPKGWSKDVSCELKRHERYLSNDSSKTKGSWGTIFFWGFIIWLIYFIF